MQRFFILGIVAVSAAVLTGCSHQGSDMEGTPPQAMEFYKEKNPGKIQEIQEEEERIAALPTYSLEEVAEHNTESDCWTVVDDMVADVTEFFGKHPGGDDNLAKACGVDATELFESVKKHDPNGYERLKELQIGVIGEPLEDEEGE